MSFADRIFSSVVRGWVSWVPLVVKLRPPWLIMEDCGGSGLPATVPRLPAPISYQLRVGQVNEIAVISYGGKVFAFRRSFGVLLLLDLRVG